jgi:hypothetical protein
MPHQVNVVSAARSNEDFRRVLFTGERSQLVVMTIPPGGEVGDERHDHVEQTLFCLSGNGMAILSPRSRESARYATSRSSRRSGQRRSRQRLKGQSRVCYSDAPRVEK